jgi:5'-phosphate synthase pdxT subunit
MSRIGVLALQGGFSPHARALIEIGHVAVEVRDAAELTRCDGLVLPGGESTTQLKLLCRHDLSDALEAFVRSGRPLLCTCAGLILAAREVQNPSQRSFGWLDVAVARNAWGRQVRSFEARSDDGSLALLFIRAPRISQVGDKAQILATFQGEPILVRQGNVTGASFHPELTADRRIHLEIFGGTLTKKVRDPDEQTARVSI